MNLKKYYQLGDLQMNISLSLDNIAKAVSEVRGVSIKDLKSKSRKKYISESRHIFCFVAHFAGYSLGHIGKYVNRDHTSILNAKNRALGFMDIYPVFLQQVNQVILCLGIIR